MMQIQFYPSEHLAQTMLFHKIEYHLAICVYQLYSDISQSDLGKIARQWDHCGQ
jgi:hypothetical protein